jgi:3-oxoacyl-[acyl-carrier protein] reductase
MTEDMWDLVIDVNLKAVWKLSQMATKVMKEAGKGGCILNAASVVAHYGNFGQSNYVATKAGVIGMTKTMAKELGKYAIRVNAIAPGFIATDMVKKMPANVLASMEEKTPLKKLGQPSDIANAYSFLASEKAQFITGTCLNVDGGIVIGL